MVKGISKQVIVLNAPEPKLFEQAIFILKEDTPGVTDEILMKEAKKLLSSGAPAGRKEKLFGVLCALGGGVAVGLLWLITFLL